MKWKFTNVHHSFRKQAGISLNEYALLDIIYKTQTHPETTCDGWANVSYSDIGDFLGLSKGAVAGIVERCASIGLLEINQKTNRLKKTTPLWYKNAYIDDDEQTKSDADLVIVQKVNVQNLNGNVQKVNDERSESERHTLVLKERRSKGNNGGVHTLFDADDDIKIKIGVSTDDTATEIIEYLNRAANRNFAATGQGSSANRKFIETLFSSKVEKVSKQDFFDVIDLKCLQWIHSQKMKQHLQPSTLFAKANFLKYLGEVVEARVRQPNAQEYLEAIPKNQMTQQGKAQFERIRAEASFHNTMDILEGRYDENGMRIGGYDD